MTIDILADLATIVGALSVPFASFVFWREKNRQRDERRLATYTEAAREYREYLKLCLVHHELQVYDYQPDLTVRIRLIARRFFCRSDTCPRRVFTERLPDLAVPYARRTRRLSEALQAIARRSA